MLSPTRRYIREVNAQCSIDELTAFVCSLDKLLVFNHPVSLYILAVRSLKTNLTSNLWCQWVPVGTIACVISSSVLFLSLSSASFQTQITSGCKTVFFYPQHLLASFYGVIAFLHVFHVSDLVFKSLKTFQIKPSSATMRIKGQRFI